MIRIHDKSKNGIYNSNMELIDNFTDYSSKNLDFDKPVNIEFLDDEDNAKNPLGTTAHYNPDQMKITIYVTGRHLKDILRSISHELIHHVQNCRGDLGNIGTELGYAQKDKHMRGMEHEAYTMGNIMNFRDFEDNYKKGLNKMSKLKENRLKKLNSMLMKEQSANIQQQQANQAATQAAMAPSGAPSKLSPGGEIEKKAVYQTASNLMGNLRSIQKGAKLLKKNAAFIKRESPIYVDIVNISKELTDKVDSLVPALRKSLAIPELDKLSIEQIQNQTFANISNKMFEIYRAKKDLDKKIENIQIELDNRRDKASSSTDDKLAEADDWLEAYKGGLNVFVKEVAGVYKAAGGKRRKSPAVAKGKGRAVGSPAVAKGKGRAVGSTRGPSSRVKFDREIKAVQTALANLGYGDLLGKSGVDGKYGRMTQSAVDEFVKYNPSYSNDPKTLLRQLVKANIIEANGSLKKQNLQKKSNKAAPPPPPPQAAPPPQQYYDPQQGPTEPVGEPEFLIMTPFGTFGIG